MTDRERFDTKWVHDTTTGCHLWTAALDADGYGRFYWSGSTGLAHRFVWEDEHGHVPEGLVVRHVTCSTPGCVNPDHLDVGTQQDNMDDRERDGNTPRGTRNGRSKLEPSDVRAIRAKAAQGVSRRQLADEYGVHHSTVTDIVKQRIWKNV